MSNSEDAAVAAAVVRRKSARSLSSPPKEDLEKAEAEKGMVLKNTFIAE